MKKILLVIGLGIALGGCAQLQKIGTAFTVVTASVANPVTKSRLAEIEAAENVIFTGLIQYKKACIAGLADKNCKANIKAIQAYTTKIPPLNTQLRAFVKNNDQINAVVVYNQLQTLLDNIKPLAAQAGVKIGA